MKKLLFVTIMLCAGLVYGGGSEVPWPLTAQEAVFIDDLAGIWTSSTTDQAQTVYQVYYKEILTTEYCPYLLGINEINVATGHVVQQGASVYCIRQPRQVSFVMYDALGRPNNIVTFVGVRKEAKDVEVLGSQFVGLTIFSYGSEGEQPERLSQDLLHKSAE